VTKGIEWLSADSNDRVVNECPNCANTDPKRTILRTRWPCGRTDDARAALVFCANCGCGFFYPAYPPDYETNPVGGEGALAFYLQQGAGLWSITSNLAVLNKPAGSRFLEVRDPDRPGSSPPLVG
jgi:hypothetical protein